MMGALCDKRNLLFAGSFYVWHNSSNDYTNNQPIPRDVPAGLGDKYALES